MRCTRCERPICPDCMVPASVGFQCPECVRAGAREVRDARTVFGGRADGGAAVVTRTIIGACVAMFLAQLALGPAFAARLWLIGGIPGDSVFLSEPGVATGEVWRLLTATFLHLDLIHLLFNMYALYLFGPTLEGLLGRARFSALYLVSGLGGSAASYAFSDVLQPSIGASGAVFGLLGAFLVVARRTGRDARSLYVILALNLAYGFYASGIDWRAHLGGLVAGVLTGTALAYAPAERRTPVQVAGTVAVLVLAVAVVTVRTLQISA